MELHDEDNDQTVEDACFRHRDYHPPPPSQKKNIQARFYVQTEVFPFSRRHRQWLILCWLPGNQPLIHTWCQWFAIMAFVVQMKVNIIPSILMFLDILKLIKLHLPPTIWWWGPIDPHLKLDVIIKELLKVKSPRFMEEVWQQCMETAPSECWTNSSPSPGVSPPP